MTKQEQAYRNVYSYIRTLEKITEKGQSPVIKESLAIIYSLVKKAEPMAPIGATVTDNGRALAVCPRCKKSLAAGVKVCCDCGQKIKWNL